MLNEMGIFVDSESKSQNNHILIKIWTVDAFDFAA